MKKQFRLKEIIAGIISLLLVLSLAGCGGGKEQPSKNSSDSSTQKQYIMRIGTVTIKPQMQAATMEEYKKRLEAKLGDKVKVELYPASQLGTIQQMVQGLQNGSVQAVVIPTGFYANVAPAISVFDVPFLLTNAEQGARILNSGGDKELAKYLATKGLVPMSWVQSLRPSMVSKKPITKMEDFKGQKIRVFPNPIAQMTFTSFGASPTTIDTAELTSAIQQGTIDSITGDASLFASMKLYQQAPNLLIAPQGAVLAPFMASKTWLDNLPTDIKDTVIKTAMETVTEFEYDYVKTYEANILKDFEAKGVKITEPSPEFNAQMQQASIAVHDKYKNSGPEAKAIYDSLKAEIDKAK